MLDKRRLFEKGVHKIISLCLRKYNVTALPVNSTEKCEIDFITCYEIRRDLNVSDENLRNKQQQQQQQLHQTFETGIFKIWILATFSAARSKSKNICCGTSVTSNPFT